MKSFLSLFLCLPFALNAQDYALVQLESSSRHHEWVKINVDDKDIHAFVVYPEKSTKTLAAIVIHENRGLTDWVRSFTDQLAEAGYLAIAPDLLSNFSDNVSKTSDFSSSDEARDAIYQLDPQFVTNALQAVQDYAAHVEASTGETVVMGFCWGGSQTFRFATNNQEIEAAYVFYGTAPKEPEELKQITAPVYGFYGENDQRVNTTIPETENVMERAGKTYQYEIYEGAGHAFMRRGDDPEEMGPNKQARDKAWERLVELLNQVD